MLNLGIRTSCGPRKATGISIWPSIPKKVGYHWLKFFFLYFYYLFTVKTNSSIFFLLFMTWKYSLETGNNWTCQGHLLSFLEWENRQANWRPFRKRKCPIRAETTAEGCRSSLSSGRQPFPFLQKQKKGIQNQFL